MIADEQTHTLPADRDGLERFARFLGFDGPRCASPRRCSGTCDGAAPLCAPVRGCAAAEARAGALRFPADTDDPETLDKLAAMGFQPPARGLGGGARAGSRAAIVRCKSEFAREHLTELVPVLIDHLARTEIRTARLPLRSLSRRAAWRRAAVVAAAAQSRPGRASRAHARHRAAARRHPGALAAGDGCADRAVLLRRAAGRGEAATRELARSLAQARSLRGPSRPRPPVRPGADVPDRRAHPLRHGFGRAGGRGLCAPCRCGDPRGASGGRGDFVAAHGRCAAADARCSRWASSAGAR